MHSCVRQTNSYKITHEHSKSYISQLSSGLYLHFPNTVSLVIQYSRFPQYMLISLYSLFSCFSYIPFFTLFTMFLIFPIFAIISVYPVLSIFLLVLVFLIFPLFPSFPICSYLPSDPYFTDIP